MEKAETPQIIGYAPYSCPYCGKEIWIPEAKAYKAITREENLNRAQQEVKSLRPNRKRG